MIYSMTCSAMTSLFQLIVSIAHNSYMQNSVETTSSTKENSEIFLTLIYSKLAKTLLIRHQYNQLGNTNS